MQVVGQTGERDSETVAVTGQFDSLAGTKSRKGKSAGTNNFTFRQSSSREKLIYLQIPMLV